MRAALTLLGLAALIGAPAGVSASRGGALARARSVRRASGKRGRPLGVRRPGTEIAGRWLLKVEPARGADLALRASRRPGRAAAALLQGAAGRTPSEHQLLPRLLSVEKQRACPVLCTPGNKYYWSTEDCLYDCKRLANLFDGMDAPRPGTAIQGEAEYEADGVHCFPVADVNEIGIPPFGDIDVRHDDVIDFEELALYGFLLCVPDAAVNDLFYSLDRDQDMLVTPEEWSSTGLVVSAEAQTPTTTQTTTPVPTADGYVRELSAAPLPAFDSLDVNGDLHVEPYEFAGAFMKTIVGQHPLMSPLTRAAVFDNLAHVMFQNFDTDGDHFISKEEWDAATGVLQASSPPTASEPPAPQGSTTSSPSGHEMGAAAGDNELGDVDG